MYQAKVPAAILSDIWLLPVGKLFSVSRRNSVFFFLMSQQLDIDLLKSEEKHAYHMSNHISDLLGPEWHTWIAYPKQKGQVSIKILCHANLFHLLPSVEQDLVKKCRVPGEYNLSWGLVGFGSATIQMANQNTVHMVDEVPQATFLHFDAEPCCYW